MWRTTQNSLIRKITTTGTVSTLAGTAGRLGQCQRNRDRRSLQPTRSTWQWTSTAASVYVADSGNHFIRKITSVGLVTTLAGQVAASGSVNGTGSAARFTYPSGAAVDGSGNVFISDFGNNLVRKISSRGRGHHFGGQGWFSWNQQRQPAPPPGSAVPPA